MGEDRYPSFLIRGVCKRFEHFHMSCKMLSSLSDGLWLQLRGATY